MYTYVTDILGTGKQPLLYYRGLHYLKAIAHVILIYLHIWTHNQVQRGFCNWGAFYNVLTKPCGLNVDHYPCTKDQNRYGQISMTIMG